jgi:hypothetical protein
MVNLNYPFRQNGYLGLDPKDKGLTNSHPYPQHLKSRNKMCCKEGTCITYNSYFRFRFISAIMTEMNDTELIMEFFTIIFS